MEPLAQQKSEAMCWQCGGVRPEALFCQECTALQRPAKDYFEFFGIPPSLSLDAEDLKKRFYELSRKLHPDRYSRRPQPERDLSAEATAVLNDGYRTLRDPILRAEYLLKSKGFDIGEQKSKDVPQELLEEVFELNMAIDEFRHGDMDAQPQIEQAAGHFETLRSEIDEQLSRLFERYDREPVQETLSEIRSTLNRRRYISNLLGEVESLLAA